MGVNKIVPATLEEFVAYLKAQTKKFIEKKTDYAQLPVGAVVVCQRGNVVWDEDDPCEQPILAKCGSDGNRSLRAGGCYFEKIPKYWSYLSNWFESELRGSVRPATDKEIETLVGQLFNAKEFEFLIPEGATETNEKPPHTD